LPQLKTLGGGPILSGAALTPRIRSRQKLASDTVIEAKRKLRGM
jgi:hypothetical protein